MSCQCAWLRLASPRSSWGNPCDALSDVYHMQAGCLRSLHILMPAQTRVLQHRVPLTWAPTTPVEVLRQPATQRVVLQDAFETNQQANIALPAARMLHPHIPTYRSADMSLACTVSVCISSLPDAQYMTSCMPCLAACGCTANRTR
jgi:hypothetical protein